jgi:two-component system response regulator VicR
MAGISILYVEDEPFLGRIVKESLESRDFQVHMVADGQEAVSLFRSVQPQICVLDIMLPNKDGYTIAQEIRSLNAEVPIIFVTAKTQTEDVVKGFETGGNDYLRKPFSMEELIVRVNNLLRLSIKKGGEKSSTVAMGSYTFHPDRYELRRGEAVRKLSHREAMLLTVLTENREAVIQRKDILMRVWGDDSFFNSRNLDVYVTKLRDYLGEDPAVQIVTIKGVGYRFVS